MRIHHRNQTAIVALLAGCLLAGCATKMTARELETRLNRESQTVASRQAIRRVFPVYAQTKMEAWILRWEAKTEPESSPPSLQLADGFRIGQLRKVDYVVGGPFPELSDQLVLNGLLLNEGRAIAIEEPTALQRRLDGQVLAIRTDQPRRARDLLREHSAIRAAVLFGDSLHLTLRAERGSWPSALAALRANGIQVLDEQDVEPSLEDVFIDMVQPTVAHA